MTADETPSFAPDIRPAWWKIALSCVAGVITGGVAFLVLLWPIIPLLDLIFGRGVWQADVKDWPEVLRIPVLIVYWAMPLALGQWLSALLSGWSKTVYFAAALETLHMVTNLWAYELAYLWALPALIALGLARLGWAERAAERARAREAKHSSPSAKRSAY